MNPSSVFSPSSVRRNPDAISRRAYEIWNREGRLDGCDLRHWLQAEQELSAESPQGSGADPAGDVSGNGNGNGTGYGNGRAEESPATTASARTSSIPEGETPSVSAVEKTKRSSTADTPGKTSARGSASKRKSPSSGRGPAL